MKLVKTQMQSVTVHDNVIEGCGGAIQLSIEIPYSLSGVAREEITSSGWAVLHLPIPSFEHLSISWAYTIFVERRF
ncbi:unnamed protein product [Strongylus vulgaris]|uniref:Uncharacterized protein n=1 Tax=Strongylus vulgaris TaxID=40348 RepID=A0A3P7KI41_STRVU|nr:unnamed protein product [Strongylus vulgaris]